MLGTLLKEEFIQINAPANDWMDAVTVATAPLIKAGRVEPSYLDKIIETTLTIGPYYVLAPGVAMAHARPEDGVNRMAVAFTTLQQPINFGNQDNDPVTFIIVLAAVDCTSHIETLMQIAHLLENQADVNQIKSAANAADVFHILQKY